jgi:multiple sugar transport system substrate-binding protein
VRRTILGYLAGPLGWFIMGVIGIVLFNSVRALVFPAPQLEPDDHPDNHATIRRLPDNADAQHSAMVDQAQSADGGVDIYNLDVTWIAEFGAAHYIRPLTGVDTTGFLEEPLSTCRVAGTLWALPFNTDAGLLYYRTDIYPGRPPRQLPPSAQDMADLAGADPRLQAGYVTQLYGYEGLTVNTLEAIWAGGGEVVAPDNTATIESPLAQAALARLAHGLTGSGGHLPALLPSSTQAQEPDSTNAFASGAVALMRNWPVAYGQLRHRPAPVDGVDVKNAFYVTQLPGPSVLGGQDLAVASDSTKPKAAQALIEFLTSDASERQLYGDGGLAATRTSAYLDPVIRDKQPAADVLLDAIQHARQRPVTPHYPLFSSVLQNIVTTALAHGGQVPPGSNRRLTDALLGRL